MKQSILGLGVAVLLATAGLGTAGAVNCKQVNKYLQTGRSAQDVAETMVISEGDVRKCQEQAGEQKPAEGAKGAEPKTGGGTGGEQKK